MNNNSSGWISIHDDIKDYCKELVAPDGTLIIFKKDHSVVITPDGYKVHLHNSFCDNFNKLKKYDGKRFYKQCFDLAMKQEDK